MTELTVTIMTAEEAINGSIKYSVSIPVELDFYLLGILQVYHRKIDYWSWLALKGEKSERYPAANLTRSAFFLFRYHDLLECRKQKVLPFETYLLQRRFYIARPVA